MVVTQMAVNVHGESAAILMAHRALGDLKYRLLYSSHAKDSLWSLDLSATYRR
jgi:hypothetical protein